MLISKLSCSLVGQTQVISIAPGSRAAAAYGVNQVKERFACNYGLNPAFRARLDDGRLSVSGTDPQGEARIVELNGHPFYLATLYLPQLSSTEDNPHPLIVAFLRAAVGVRIQTT
ncbi:MAG: hypothetical protein LLG44_02905 [Chloroflexi bacterium]|nr:hypothetical protein [Chloroflexota bacterium]